RQRHHPGPPVSPARPSLPVGYRRPALGSPRRSDESVLIPSRTVPADPRRQRTAPAGLNHFREFHRAFTAPRPGAPRYDKPFGKAQGDPRAVSPTAWVFALSSSEMGVES